MVVNITNHNLEEQETIISSPLKVSLLSLSLGKEAECLLFSFSSFKIKLNHP